MSGVNSKDGSLPNDESRGIAAREGDPAPGERTVLSSHYETGKLQPGVHCSVERAFFTQHLAGSMPDIVARLSRSKSLPWRPDSGKLLTSASPMAGLIGAPESWRRTWAFLTAGWLGCGLGPGSQAHRGLGYLSPYTIRKLKRKAADVIGLDSNRR